MLLKYLNFEQENKFKFKNEFLVNGSNEAIKNFVINNMGGILPYYCVYHKVEQHKINF